MEMLKTAFVAVVVALIVGFVIGLPLGVVGCKVFGFESVVTGNMGLIRNLAFLWMAVVIVGAGVSNQP